VPQYAPVDPLLPTPVLTALLALGGCVAGWALLRGAPSSSRLPELSSGRLVALVLWGALLALLWWSDYPAAWRLPELIVYLAEVSLAAFRVLCVTAVGAVLFVGVVVTLFSSRPR
jgi:hypothetical protein